MVKRLSTMWETWVQALGWEDPLEKEMAIHSSTIAWKIPWTEEPGRLQSTGLQRVGHDWVTSLSLTLPTKVHLVKAMVFPWVLYGCESWTIKKAECQRIDAFELCCWRRLLRVPWTARRSNQSILKEISPSVHWKDWCWNWNSNILATWWGELTHLKRPWCWESTFKIEGRKRGRQRMRRLDGITNSMDMSLSKL